LHCFFYQKSNLKKNLLMYDYICLYKFIFLHKKFFYRVRNDRFFLPTICYSRLSVCVALHYCYSVAMCRMRPYIIFIIKTANTLVALPVHVLFVRDYYLSPSGPGKLLLQVWMNKLFLLFLLISQEESPTSYRSDYIDKKNINLMQIQIISRTKFSNLLITIRIRNVGTYIGICRHRSSNVSARNSEFAYTFFLRVRESNSRSNCSIWANLLWTYQLCEQFAYWF